MERPVRRLPAFRRDAIAQPGIAKRLSESFLPAQPSPFAQVILHVPSLGNAVLRAQLRAAVDRVAASMRDHGVAAILFLKTGQPRPVRVVLILAIAGKEVFVEASDPFEGDGIDRETRISMAGQLPVEPPVK